MVRAVALVEALRYCDSINTRHDHYHLDLYARVVGL